MLSPARFCGRRRASDAWFRLRLRSLWLRIQNPSSWSASSPSETCIAAWRLMTGALRTCASKRSCDPCLPVVARAGRLKKRAGNSLSIVRRACPLRIRRAAVCDARSRSSNLGCEPVPATTAAIRLIGSRIAAPITRTCPSSATTKKARPRHCRTVATKQRSRFHVHPSRAWPSVPLRFPRCPGQFIRTTH